MRVCVLVHQFPVRSETFIVNHVAELRRRSHDVTVVPLSPNVSDPWDMPAPVVALAHDVVPPPAPPSGTLGWATVAAASMAKGPAAVRYSTGRHIPASGGRTARLLAAERIRRAGPFDVVHAQFATTAPSAVALRAAGIVKAPIVCSIHGQDVNVDRDRRGRLLASIASELDAVTTGTAFMRGVAEEIGVPAAKIHVWPQGVDVDRDPHPRPPSGGLRVLSVGRLVEFKGVDDSLRVIAAARDRIPGLRYTVIGDGPLWDILQAQADDLGIDDITTFAGPQDHHDVLAAHGDADVFLHMGKVGHDGSREGQGVAPAEAGASGLACVATRSGGLPEVVIDGQTGIVVESGDIAGAADALVRLAHDSGLRAVLGENGRRFVAANYSMAASMDRIEAIYREVLTQR